MQQRSFPGYFGDCLFDERNHRQVAIGSVPRSSVTDRVDGRISCLPDLVAWRGGAAISWAMGVGFGEYRWLEGPARGKTRATGCQVDSSVDRHEAIAVTPVGALPCLTTIVSVLHGAFIACSCSSRHLPEPQPERAAQVLVGRAQGVARCLSM